MSDSTPSVVTSGAVAEATGAAYVSFDFLGETYLVAPSTEWDWATLEAFESGRITAFVTAILAPASLAAFKAARPKLPVVNEFVAAIQKALGISGN